MFSADLGGITASSTPASNDPPFQKVALLLHGDGTNGAQNNTFVDGSSNNFSITRAGNVAQGTFSPFSLAEGQWSNYFDGSGDFLEVSTGIANFGTSDFTIECWVNYSTPSGDIIDTRGGSYANGAIAIRLDGTSLYTVVGATTTITTPAPTSNTWHHISVCRASGSTKLFVDGVQKGSTYADSNNYGDFYSRIGSYAGGAANYLAGYISNMRIVKGTALYTSNFTPPTAPLTAISGTSLLTCQSNRFKDNSSNNFTITRNGDTKVTAFSPFAPSAAYDTSTNGGSGYFDGSGDYLSVPSSSAFAYGTGDFTWEVWIYPTASNWASGNFYLLDHGSNGGVLQYYSNQIRFHDGPSTFDTGAVVKPYTWSHVAVTRSSATLRVFVNGVTYIYGTSDTVNFGNNSVTVGDYGGHGYSMFGCITDVRIVKGTALYTTNFTPPTAPLTAVANTQLLLNCTNAGIIDNAGKNDIETVGNAQISTSVKKYGTGSIYFDGSGDYLKFPVNDLYAFGTGDFTVEFWIYYNSVSGYQTVFDINYSTSPNLIFQPGSGQMLVYMNGTAITLSSSATDTTSTWYHYALSRSGSTVRLFRNGVSVASATYSGNVGNFSVPLYIGGSLGGGGYYATVCIDDLRITKGVALYTANFTPPTQAFPNV